MNNRWLSEPYTSREKRYAARLAAAMWFFSGIAIGILIGWSAH